MNSDGRLKGNDDKGRSEDSRHLNTSHTCGGFAWQMSGRASARVATAHELVPSRCCTCPRLYDASTDDW